MNQLQFFGSLELGLVYALVAIGVFLSFRIIDFPDLTVDGSFTLGAAISATLITSGFDPILSIFAAMISGGLAGAITGYLNTKWNILGLLAGILTMTALYSINLRVMGKPNITIMEEVAIFSADYVIYFILFLVCLLIGLLATFFNSDFGLAIRAIGINPKVSSAYGINVNSMKIIALALSNSIVALAGSLFTQINGFADISMGTGTIILGLAAVIIGEAIFHPVTILFALISAALGSIAYRVAIALAINTESFGLEPSDLNLITAALVAATLMLRKTKSS